MCCLGLIFWIFGIFSLARVIFPFFMLFFFALSLSLLPKQHKKALTFQHLVNCSHTHDDSSDDKVYPQEKFAQCLCRMFAVQLFANCTNFFRNCLFFFAMNEQKKWRNLIFYLFFDMHKFISVVYAGCVLILRLRECGCKLLLCSMVAVKLQRHKNI